MVLPQEHSPPTCQGKGSTDGRGAGMRDCGLRAHGEVAEWLMAAVLKTAGESLVGSNPTLSANTKRPSGPVRSGGVLAVVAPRARAVNRRNGSAYRRARAQVLAAARATGAPCGTCLGPMGTGPPRPTTIIRMRDGGTDDPTNLRAVHGTCNRERERERESTLPRARVVRRAR